MKREFGLLLIVVVMITLATGCPTSVPGVRYYEIAIENHTSMELTELYISPCGESFWGENWLTSPIDPHTSYHEYIFANQCWDIMIVTEYGQQMTTQLFMDSDYIIPVDETKSGEMFGASGEVYWEDGDILLKEFPPLAE